MNMTLEFWQKVSGLKDIVNEENLEAVNTVTTVLQDLNDVEISAFSFMLTAVHFEHPVEDTIAFVAKTNTAPDYIKKCRDATRKMFDELIIKAKEKYVK